MVLLSHTLQFSWPFYTNLSIIGFGLHGSLKCLNISYARREGKDIAHDLKLLQIGLSSSIDPPHWLLEGISNVLNILHRPLIMSEDD
jgi:hypothetical protein